MDHYDWLMEHRQLRANAKGNSIFNQVSFTKSHLVGLYDQYVNAYNKAVSEAAKQEEKPIKEEDGSESEGEGECECDQCLFDQTKPFGGKSALPDVQVLPKKFAIPQSNKWYASKQRSLAMEPNEESKVLGAPPAPAPAPGGARPRARPRPAAPVAPVAPVAKPEAKKAEPAKPEAKKAEPAKPAPAKPEAKKAEPARHVAVPILPGPAMPAAKPAPMVVDPNKLEEKKAAPKPEEVFHIDDPAEDIKKIEEDAKNAISRLREEKDNQRFKIILESVPLAYGERLANNYKDAKFSEETWQQLLLEPNSDKLRDQLASKNIDPIIIEQIIDVYLQALQDMANELNYQYDGNSDDDIYSDDEHKTPKKEKKNKKEPEPETPLKEPDFESLEPEIPDAKDLIRGVTEPPAESPIPETPAEAKELRGAVDEAMYLEGSKIEKEFVDDTYKPEDIKAKKTPAEIANDNEPRKTNFDNSEWYEVVYYALPAGINTRSKFIEAHNKKELDFETMQKIGKRLNGLFENPPPEIRQLVSVASNFTNPDNIYAKLLAVLDAVSLIKRSSYWGADFKEAEQSLIGLNKTKNNKKEKVPPLKNTPHGKAISLNKPFLASNSDTYKEGMRVLRSKEADGDKIQKLNAIITDYWLIRDQDVKKLTPSDAHPVDYREVGSTKEQLAKLKEQIIKFQPSGQKELFGSPVKIKGKVYQPRFDE